MSEMRGPFRPAEKAQSSGPAITATILSSLGCSGWIILSLLLLPYRENADHDAVDAVTNVFAFGINFVFLATGSAISGTLSFSGLLTGAVALGGGRNHIAIAAVTLGALGLIGGAMLILWRFHLVFG